MNREELKDLASAYALGTLSGPDLDRFEALLSSGDAAAFEVLREFEETLTSLAMETPSAIPPASVKAALLSRIAALPAKIPVDLAARRVAREHPVPAPQSWWNGFVSGVIAASVLAFVAGYSFWDTSRQRYQKVQQQLAELRTGLDTLEQSRAELQKTVAAQSALAEIVKDPGTQVVVLKGLEPDPSASGRMMWHSRAGGLFVAAGLPAPPEGKTYQLWAIQDSKPVSAGVFAVRPDGTCELAVPEIPGVKTQVQVFAVTLEPAGGLPAPSGPMYLAGKGGI